MICDFNSTRLPGSTGYGPWFHEYDEFHISMGKLKKCQLFNKDCFDLLDSIYKTNYPSHLIQGIELGLDIENLNGQSFYGESVVSPTNSPNNGGHIFPQKEIINGKRIMWAKIPVYKCK